MKKEEGMPKVGKAISGRSEEEKRLKLREAGLEVVDSKVGGDISV